MSRGMTTYAQTTSPEKSPLKNGAHNLNDLLQEMAEREVDMADWLLIHHRPV